MFTINTMNNENIINSSTNINIINDNKEKQNNSSLFKSKILMEYNYIIKDINSNMTLSEIKNDINKRLNLKEDEYELFIGDNSINLLEEDKSIIFLLNQYKIDPKINIKAYKNIFDCLREINNYENNLTQKISSKVDDIKKLNIEYENLMEDLNNT